MIDLLYNLSLAYGIRKSRLLLCRLSPMFLNVLLLGGDLPSQLQKAYVKVFSNGQCEEYLKVERPRIEILDSMLCAGLVLNFSKYSF